MASLIRRKNKSVWVAQIKFQGKTIQRSTGIPIAADADHSERARREEALLWAEEWERSVKSQGSPSVAVARFAGALGVPITFESAARSAPEVPLVRVWMDTYAEFKAPFLSRATAYSNMRAFQLFEQFVRAGGVTDAYGNRILWDALRLSDVKLPHARAFARAQLRRVEAKTVERYLGSLSGCFREAYDRELIARNPFHAAASVLRGEERSAQRLAFTREEIAVLLSRLPDWWQRMVRCSIFLGGLRLGDCATLRWDMFDFSSGVFTRRQQKTGGLVQLPIVPELAEVLLAVKPRHRVWVNPIAFGHVRMGVGPDGEEVVESTSKLSSEFSAWVRCLFPELEEAASKVALVGDRRAQLRKGFHSIREFVVTELNNAAVPEVISMKITGHKSPAVHRSYNRSGVEVLREAMRVLSGR